MKTDKIKEVKFLRNQLGFKNKKIADVIHLGFADVVKLLHQFSLELKMEISGLKKEVKNKEEEIKTLTRLTSKHIYEQDQIIFDLQEENNKLKDKLESK